MRYPASEKLEIIRVVERSHLPVRRTLDKLGIPATTFYRWYDRYRAFGEAGLEDRTSGPGRIWNRIPDDVRRQIVDLALDEPELSPRELAVTFTDTKGYFVSEASVYRLLKAHDLITSPAFVVIKAADVNGGGIMHHARRPGGPVAAAQNCATHGPLSVATRGRRCTAWSSMRRFDWRLSTRV